MSQFPSCITIQFIAQIKQLHISYLGTRGIQIKYGIRRFCGKFSGEIFVNSYNNLVVLIVHTIWSLALDKWNSYGGVCENRELVIIFGGV
jgi:hypothetical protein